MHVPFVVVPGVSRLKVPRQVNRPFFGNRFKNFHAREITKQKRVAHHTDLQVAICLPAIVVRLLLRYNAPAREFATRDEIVLRELLPLWLTGPDNPLYLRSHERRAAATRQFTVNPHRGFRRRALVELLVVVGEEIVRFPKTLDTNHPGDVARLFVRKF